MSPIHARFEWTREEMRSAVRNASRLPDATSRRRAVYRWMAIAAVVFGFWLLWPVEWSGRAETPPLLLRFLGGLVAGAAISMKAFHEAQWKRVDATFAAMPDWARAVDWTVDDEGFSGGTARTRTEFGWDAVTRFVDAGAGSLIFVAGVSYHWLPRHAFGSEVDAARLGSMDRARGLLAGASPESEFPPER